MTAGMILYQFHGAVTTMDHDVELIEEDEMEYYPSGTKYSDVSTDFLHRPALC